MNDQLSRHVKRRRDGSHRASTRALLAFPIAAALLAAPGTGAQDTGPSAAFEAPRELQAQIQRLASRHGFSVKGLEKLSDERARTVGGDLGARLGGLLTDYNHVLLYDRDRGTVERLLILSRKAEADTTPDTLTVDTKPRGSHHAVDALLVGPNQQPVNATLVIDTGASTVVLRQSMIEQLGFEPSELSEQLVQTANGRLTAIGGMLGVVEVGQAVAYDIPVSFVPDTKIGDHMLLGMSFLGRFLVTLDDANNQIIFVAK